MKKNKGRKFAAIFLGLLFLVALFFTGGKWDGNRRFTLVIEAEPLLLFSISPASREAVVVPIPSNVILDVPYGYGTYKAGAVYTLGNLDKNRTGGILLSKSVENTFGVMVEGFIAAKEGKFVAPPDYQKLIDLKKTYFSWLGAFPAVFKFGNQYPNIATNLSFVDILRLWDAVKNLRSDEITMVNLPDSHVLMEEKLPDGTIVETVDQKALDRFISGSFEDKKIRLQNVAVEVVNGTNEDKIASQFSRILHNLGANVVVNSTAEAPDEKSCTIKAADKNLFSNVIVERLKSFYGCQTEEDKNFGAADIKIILGKKFIK